MDIIGDRPHDPPGAEQAAHNAPGPRCLVVNYHYVRHADPEWQHGVQGLAPTAFAAQLDRLCSLLEPIAWQELYAWFAGTGSLPERCFLLTFEDGLLDHARVAAPMLEDRGIRGVFFTPGAVLTSEEILPPHAIHLLLAALGDERLERELCDVLTSRHGWHAPVDDGDPDAARRMYHYEVPIRASLKSLLTVRLPISVRDSAIRALFERHIGSSRAWSKRWYAGWNEFADMSARGHTVGGQGFSLEPLLRLSEASRRSEVSRVATVLRSGLGPAPRPFSYPYGSFDASTIDMCRAAGFVQAFTRHGGWVEAAIDPMSMPRIGATDLSTDPDAGLDAEPDARSDVQSAHPDQPVGHERAGVYNP